ncbi:nitrate reductase molybdenum cofactor assembly chaperone [Rhodococcus spelaei]|uniref:Nitrate reductase molybdenum cofactor assembly chaperone n=1 Tax=Rhodococcus spelaei TaxID=2546320 RepID=A0A541B7Y3_9NOCA|nr:nitrate reductase molybdenum cofactor assembly chaperone [Rhodococcus spelaei]TQF68410.1 nitrate reductase molybdenum cofactor assembly chaperone [Rhodococcus spelaei]
MGALGLRRRVAGRFRPTADTLTERDQQLVWRIAALLLDYPTEQTLGMLGDLREVAATVPGPAGEHLVECLDFMGATPRIELSALYVETFDLRRRSSLHLSYYAYGDTRNRGMALLRFKNAYRNAGVTLGDHELPDYLPVVLEFAATADAARGYRLLVTHRAVVEVLRLSLRDGGSPFAGVLDAVCMTLPDLDTDDRQQVAKLAAEGPPEEAVGLDTYALDPALHPSIDEYPEIGARR